MLSVSCVRPSTRTNPPRDAGRAGAGAGADTGAVSTAAGAGVDACWTTGALGTTGLVRAAFESPADTLPSLVAVTSALSPRRVLAALTPATASTPTTDTNPRTCMKNL